MGNLTRALSWLAAGEKITRKTVPITELAKPWDYIHVVEGSIITNDGRNATIYLQYDFDWILFIEPPGDKIAEFMYALNENLNFWLEQKDRDELTKLRGYTHSILVMLDGLSGSFDGDIETIVKHTGDAFLHELFYVGDGTDNVNHSYESLVKKCRFTKCEDELPEVDVEVICLMDTNKLGAHVIPNTHYPICSGKYTIAGWLTMDNFGICVKAWMPKPKDP